MIKIIKGEYRAIAYSDRFKELMKEHPRLFRQVETCLKQLQQEGDSAFENDCIVTFSLKLPETNIYKVDIKHNGSWFLKISEFPFGGVRQAESTNEAVNRLRDKPWAEVISFDFAYSDAKRRYYVSPWRDLSHVIRLRQGDFPKNVEGNPHLAKILSEKIQDLTKLLSDFYDVRGNIVFDLASKKFLLFDLHKYRKPGEKVV